MCNVHISNAYFWAAYIYISSNSDAILAVSTDGRSTRLVFRESEVTPGA